MANRNSITLGLPGNPLGSVLREVAREARRSTRDPSATQYATQEDFAALQAQVEELQARPVPLRMYNTVGVTGVGGIGSWTFPAPFSAPPVVLATVYNPFIGPCMLVTHTLTTTGVQFSVWDGASVPVASVPVHLLAIEPSN